MKTLDEFKKAVYEKAAGGLKKQKLRKKMYAAGLSVLCLVVAAAFVGGLLPWGGVAPGTGDGSNPPAQSAPGPDVSGSGSGGGGKTHPFPTDKITDLMAGVVNENTETFSIDEELLYSSAEFYLNLAKKVAEKGKNLVLSPASAQFALAMTANGAHRDTLAAMESVLAGGKSVASLNRYMAAYADKLKGDKLRIANSLWIDGDRVNVYEEFLKANAAYYNAGAFYADFEDDATVEAINAWIELQTDGMIKDMLKEIGDDSIMFLINAITFDAEWKDRAVVSVLEDRIFQNYNGEKAKVTEFFYRGDSKIISLAGGKGVLMPYKDCDFSFAAILPKEGEDVYDYLDKISGDAFVKAVRSAAGGGADIYMPEFEIKSSLDLAEPLTDLGMGVAFISSGAADFTKLGTARGPISIGSVNQDAYISVTRVGTKAAAATIVEMVDECAMEMFRFDRPFVYAIVDNATNLPVFIGVLANIE